MKTTDLLLVGLIGAAVYLAIKIDRITPAAQDLAAKGDRVEGTIDSIKDQASRFLGGFGL